MPRLKSTVLFCLVACSLITLISCSNPATQAIDKAKAAENAAAKADPEAKTPDGLSPLIDTTKLKSEINGVLSSLSSGQPDTAKLKAAASDILSTDAKVLSDSGIDRLYGNSNDPAVKAAGDALKKMRNGIGITPDKLDSIRKAASQLKTN
jgi:hypothetical protein